MENSGLQFLEVPIFDKAIRDSLKNSLLKLTPKSVQIINILQNIEKERYNKELIKYSVWSCESFLENNNNEKEYWKTRNWSDLDVPLFLLCTIGYLKRDSIFSFLFARDKPSCNVKKAFSRIPESVIPWNKPKAVRFGAVNEELLELVHDVASEKGKSFIDNMCWLMYHPIQDDFSKFPSKMNEHNILVEKLRPEDAKTVLAHWKFGSDDSLPNIEDTIKRSISAGVWVDGQLTSWIISLPAGSLNALFTLEKFRRRGFAVLAVKFAVAQAIELGIYPLVEVEWDTPTSRTLMEKVGFKVAYNTSWTFCGS